MSKKITVSKAIGEALHEEMLRDEKVIVMGEDMAVMGNVFAITKGFLEELTHPSPRKALWVWQLAQPCAVCALLWNSCITTSPQNVQILCLIRLQKFAI